MYSFTSLQFQKEDNRCVYEGKNAFLWLPTGFGKLVGYEMLSCILDYKQSELGTGLSSYTVVLLVLPLVSLTIAKFTSLCMILVNLNVSVGHQVKCGTTL